MDLDLIFSIGPACRPAYHLKKHFLRFFASPLDYQMAYSLDTVLHLFRTSFTDFFSEIREDAFKKGAHNNRRVIDTKNSIVSLHHFDSAIPLPEAQKQFQNMMAKRFEVLHHAILNSNTVGLICNREDSIRELSAFLEAFGFLYPNQHFVLINIRNNQFLNAVQKKEYFLNNRLTILDYEGCDIYPKSEDYENNFWIGNPAVWDSILDNYSITNHPFITQVRQWIKEDKNILLYGAGQYCGKILHFLDKYQLRPSGIAVTDSENNPDSLNGICVRPIASYRDLSRHCVVIITVINPAAQQFIKKHLKKLGFDEIFAINDSLCIK